MGVEAASAPERALHSRHDPNDSAGSSRTNSGVRIRRKLRNRNPADLAVTTLMAPGLGMSSPVSRTGAGMLRPGIVRVRQWRGPLRSSVLHNFPPIMKQRAKLLTVSNLGDLNKSCSYESEVAQEPVMATTVDLSQQIQQAPDSDEFPPRLPPLNRRRCYPVMRIPHPNMMVVRRNPSLKPKSRYSRTSNFSANF